MFRIRLEEYPLPTQKNDVDQLIDWLVATFGLIRRRGEEHAFVNTQQPVVRLLRDHFLPNPATGIDAASLADELGLAPASLHHHLSRLQACRLVSSRSEGDGWRRHFLRGGSLLAAIELFSQEARLILRLQLAMMENWWERAEQSIPLKVETGPLTPPPDLRLWVAEPSPLPPIEGVTSLSAWMADLGLLGDRPGAAIKGDSVPVMLFAELLGRAKPLSIDEAEKLSGATKPRLMRILDRFRSAGLVERVPRTDRLPTTIWSALESQYRKRGEDWLLLKGGLQRQVSPKAIENIVKALKKGKLTPEKVEKELSSLSPEEQMLLLNLLGGRLPLGYRLVGTTPKACAESCMARMDRVLRRVRRVAEQLQAACGPN